MVPRDSQQQPQLYEQLTWNSDEQLLNKWQKKLILVQKWPFLDQKRVQNGSKFLMSEFKFIFSLINSKLCSYNKTWPYNINILEEIGQKPPKTPFCHHMQCIFDSKRTKTAKTRFFPELSLGYFIYRPEIKFKYAKLRRFYE